MYIIINRTKNERYTHEGFFPNLDDMLNQGDDLIVISLYSNTIKIPQLEVINGLNEWSFKDYSLALDIIVPNMLTKADYWDGDNSLSE